ncbi:hypothetical protein [Sediminicoccus sp. KRV36]|uniref:hypothetical protein n=1 Tax=Sediminicoccus sp. KRV36 TaxID=3133721 RepID=UPI00200DCC58|nr:hypothetical protein [Sediminicoccus rosea]UPY35934.1 hypothetical protein LHU95_17165 [Sediminicoccus rosea]
MRKTLFFLGPPTGQASPISPLIECLDLAASDATRQALSDFNRRLIAKAGRGPLDPRPIAPIWAEPLEQRQYTQFAGGLLGDAVRRDPVIALEDPGLARMLPIWRAACLHHAVTPLVVLIARDPRDVAADLATRFGLASEQAYLLWLAHMLAAEEFSRPMRRTVLNHDALYADWRSTITAAFASLDLAPPETQGPKAMALDHWLVAHAATPHPERRDISGDQPFEQLAMQLHGTMLRSAPEDRLDRHEWNKARATMKTALAEHAPDAAPPGPAEYPADDEPILARTREVSGTSRHVILHYHLFKNAGTSLDQTLKAHFGQAWSEREGQGAGWRSADIADYIAEHPQISVLSSHTALLPVPRIADVMVHPLIMLRHPLDRVRSIYEFERRQTKDTEGSILARGTDLAGYITWRLDRDGDRSIRNFQTLRLAQALPPTEGTELIRAMAAVSALPNVGVVEAYDASLRAFTLALAPHFPGLSLTPTRANVTQRPGLSLDDRLRELQQELGEGLYERLVEANAADLELHRFALRRYQDS